MKLIRPIGFGALAIASVAVWFLLAPKVDTETPTLPSATSYESLISTALSDYEANDQFSESAPQQQVVNGWVARDLLTIIAKQNVDILTAQGAVVDVTGNLQTAPFDERIPALVLIGVLAICWMGLTAPTAREAVRTEVVTPPVVEPPAPAWTQPPAG